MKAPTLRIDVVPPTPGAVRDAAPRGARRRVAVVAMAAFALAGCASLRDVPPPPAPDPAVVAPTVRTGSGAVVVPGVPELDALAPLDWRALVAEPRLARLIELALERNRDLRSALAAIDAARASWRITDSARLPTLRATATASDNRTLDLDGLDTRTSRQLSATLGIAAWEIDLWGRLGALRDAALARFEATEEARRGVQASLIADLATAWLTLAADQQRLALAQGTLGLRERTLALTQRRHALGAVSGLNVETARVAVETSRGDVALARTRIDQDLHALRLLVGTEPTPELLPRVDEVAFGNVETAASARGADAAPPAMPEAGASVARLVDVPADLPSTVLLRRTDVRIAERALLAAQGDLAAARAARLPTLTLTAQAGRTSPGLREFVTGTAATFGVAPSLTLPLLDAGGVQARVDQAAAERARALAVYEKAVQTALREVADALAVRARIDERLAASRGQVAAYARTLDLTQRRQLAGAESPLAVLDAQRQLQAAQDALITLRLTEQTNRLLLFKALGGV